jgi:hypothetical protein
VVEQPVNVAKTLQLPRRERSVESLSGSVAIRWAANAMSLSSFSLPSTALKRCRYGRYLFPAPRSRRPLDRCEQLAKLPAARMRSSLTAWIWCALRAL